MAGVPDRHVAAGLAGRIGRDGARLRQGDRRIRRDHHLRVEHSGRNPDHIVRDLFADPDARRQFRGAAVGGGFGSDRDGRVDRLPNGSPAAPCNACTGIDHAARRCLKAARRIRDRSLLRKRRPGHRPVRRLGRRQDVADQHDRGTAAAGSWNDRNRRRNTGRYRGAAPTLPCIAAGSATCSRTRGCSRISTYAGTSITGGG